MARALFIAAFFFTMTPLLISDPVGCLASLDCPVGALSLRITIACCARCSAYVCACSGAPMRDRAVLYVSNHVSWADILVIGSVAPVAFVAKREVASWPLVGITAKIQRTVFVDRTRRHQAAEAVADIVKRLKDGVSVVLFAEGTSSDGNRVLPFRSALLGAVEEASAHRWQHPYSADVDQLHRAARHPDGPPAPPAGGLVWRSRFPAAHQGIHRAGCGRCRRQLRRGSSSRC